MKTINFKKLAISCCIIAFLAISCSDNNQKSVTDGNDNAENMAEAYDLKATTEDKALQIEQDAINYYWPIPNRMSYRLLIDDMDLDNNKSTPVAMKTKVEKKDWSGLDDKNDLPVAKVVREEPTDDYWMSYDQRNRKYMELSKKMKDVPEKLETDVKKVKTNTKENIEDELVRMDIKIADITKSRPPLFSKDCMGQENPEKCSNDAVNTWMKEKIDYPESALNKNHDGIERVTFTIGKTGEIKGNIQVVSKDNPCAGCTEAAVAAVAEMPQWIPALQNGKPVEVEVTLPVKFRLK